MPNTKLRIRIVDLPREMKISKEETRNITGGAHIGQSVTNASLYRAPNIRMGIEFWRSPDVVSRVISPNKLAIK